MAEYIERETLFEEIRKEFRPYWQIPCDYEDKVTQKMVAKMRGLIDKLPSADVVEVVRCKNCKHFCPYEGEEHKGDCAELVGLESCVYEDDFCSYGERKDGDKK